MPALVKRSVGSSPGTSDDERTRVCPLRSKYCRNFSRSSAPRPAARTTEGSLYHSRLSPRAGGRRSRGRRATPPPRSNRDARDGRAAARRPGGDPHAGAPAGGGGRPRAPTRPQLRAQARGAVAARRASGDPVAGEGRVVEMATRGEIGEDLGGDRRRRTAPAQAHRQLARGPGASRKEIGGGEPRGPRVESSARTARTRYDFLKKELPAGETGARSSRLCSNDCSPVEKMPRTLRSKSSALVAASRAVSYEMVPSR